MILKFIGADGSMGLRNGKLYDVTIKTKPGSTNIWVVIENFEIRHNVFRRWVCPYSSPQSFARNWSNQ